MGKIIKIFFGLLLIALIVFTPKNYASLKIQKQGNSTSCCKDDIGVKNHCKNSSHENKNCEGDCFANCCCFQFESKIENNAQIELEIVQYQSKSLDIYSSEYKYSFHFYIYKPPIHCIS